LFDRDKILARQGIAGLPPDVRAAISRSGLRNGCLTSIAPTGTISLLAGNVSSGIEPVFDLEYRRRVRQADGSVHEEAVVDFAYALSRTSNADQADASARVVTQAALVTADGLSPRAHLLMQSALQRHVDSAISKTINCPTDLAFEAFKDVYLEAYDLGLKGCTTFRANPVTGSVLTHEPPAGASGEPIQIVEEAALQGPVEKLASSRLAGPAAAVPASAPVSSAATRASALTPTGTPGVVYMARPLERDPALAGYTYKLKWPGSDHAIYVTINDIERDGRRRPFEIFINTKNLEHYAWTVALTRMISAVFRRGGDVSFVVEELKAVFDPQGGHWVDGHYVPSLLAAIGEVIERHMLRTGFLQPADRSQAGEAVPGPGAVDVDPTLASLPSPQTGPPLARAATVGGRQPPCPRCGRPELVREAGCWTCRSCGYSRCN
jgi:ribonucleoside-diphosphate reductase alpha chain